MKNLYGEFNKEQMFQVKKSIRGSIFFLLLCVDPNTAHEYEDVNINECFKGLLLKLGGMNELLKNPLEIVNTMSLLQAALMEINKDESEFDYHTYRKLILDAGAEIAKLREED